MWGDPVPVEFQLRLCQRSMQSMSAGLQCRCHQSIPSRRQVLPPLISSILKFIPCHLFDSWVMVSDDVITQLRCHQDDAGSSWLLADGLLQMHNNTLMMLVSSATSVLSSKSSSRLLCHLPKVGGQMHRRSHRHPRHHYLHPRCHLPLQSPPSPLSQLLPLLPSLPSSPLSHCCHFYCRCRCHCCCCYPRPCHHHYCHCQHHHHHNCHFFRCRFV